MSDGSANSAEPSPGVSQAETSTKALLAISTAAIGLVVCPIVGGSVALVLASQAQREIEQSRGTKKGLALVSASRWLGWFEVAISIVIFVVLYLMLVAPYIDDGSDSSPFGKNVRCSESQWFTESNQQVLPLIPNASNVRNESKECGEQGGQFVIVAQSPQDPRKIDGVFYGNAAREGWVPYGGHPDCLQKRIAGIETFIHLAEHDLTSNVFMVDVGSAEAPLACKAVYPA